MVSFKHIGKLLIGVGTSEEYEITPMRILVSALLLGFTFFGTVALLILLTGLII
jgi:hypothetical protein|tara:strand:- start:464 stop:625 length:162 start_codon:yes stop_codon:yes gene_type:complete